MKVLVPIKRVVDDYVKILNEVVKREEPGLVILGKQSIDGDNNQTGQMLATVSGTPQGTFASEVKIEGSEVIVAINSDQ